MFSSKIFALSLLLCSSALAHVQINAELKLNEPIFKSQIIKIEAKLNVNQPLVVYEESDIRVEVIMLVEKENVAVIEWNIYHKNNVNNFELLKTSILCPEYGKKSETRLTEIINNDAAVETFSISLIANKI